ncbi:major facilitator superfamily domain-containing protein [Plectosphaerella plurivora]|uniref:Major facilitator superfamily domain-containing protein n=1 Tax=Plectosphaerella plurivora TaxID=936078 RepID=A0A9P9ABC0_9PEZI|nr:major facilitator superfamily domain-containing protein [Plectosphaerella plurivora]
MSPPNTDVTAQDVDVESRADRDSDVESVGGQRNTMTTKRLLVAIPALSVALFVSFIDQTSVSTATPSIADDLNTGAATSWIGASFLIASTAFQLINGRLSDIFGRKNLLLICLGLMAIGDLGCGFARTAEQLFACRAIAGIGGGGINSLVMIIVSDITTLQNRGTYQGLLGGVIALGNGLGPLLGGTIAQKANWRWVFWLIPILMLPTAAIMTFFLPLKHRSGDHAAKVKKIDFGGIALNMAATLLVLIPLSGAGVTYAWTSAFFLSATIIGLVLSVVFVLYEWKVPALPIMPLRLYCAPHVWALLLQSFLMGQAYFGGLFYLPIYFQSVLGYQPMAAGLLVLPLVISSSFASIGCGLYMKWANKYMSCVFSGFLLWTLGGGLNLLFDADTDLATLIGILIVQGIGIGLTLQPTLVGMYANSLNEDRAVLTGLRNFIRTIGGSFGLVVSGVILSNTLGTQLAGDQSMMGVQISQLTSSISSLDELNLSEDQRSTVLDAYMLGLHYVFIFYVACTGLCLILTYWIGNTSLSKEEKMDDEETDITETETEEKSAKGEVAVQGPVMGPDPNGRQDEKQ